MFNGNSELVEAAPIYPLKFEKRFDIDEKTGEVKKESIWCTWAKKGTGLPFETVDKVERMKQEPAVWAAIKPYYDSWMAGNAAPETGTSLAVWPGLEAHQVELLKQHRITNLEDFAALSDSDIGRLKFPGARERREKAREFLKNKGAFDEMDALRKKIAELEAAKADSDEPKRGPGRPRKDDVAA